ncbi:hypothetical protein C0995_008281 [Termitomyces sp. Mi166|nr:hypothetical protein C0995_008281 [Termitomyces sp. Mi166\
MSACRRRLCFTLFNSANDICDTSLRPGISAKGKEREKPEQERLAHETAKNHVDISEEACVQAGEIKTRATSPVAQSSGQRYIPPPPPRPCSIRPGHRSLVQSVQTHLKRGSDQLDGPKGTRPAHHHDLLSIHSDTSLPLALSTRLSDPLAAITRTERASELDILTPTQSTGGRHGTSSDNKTQHVQISTPETMAQNHASTPRMVVNSQTTTSSVVHPSDSSSHLTSSSPHMPIIDLMETPLPSTTLSVGGSATTTSETLFPTILEGLLHQEATSNTHPMGTMSIPIDDSTRPSMSTVTSDDEFRSTTSHPRKNLLARLERERFRAQGTMDVSEPMNETLTMKFQG